MKRFHEWAWGFVGKRTVCGQTKDLVSGDLLSSGLRWAPVVYDLGNIVFEKRCMNCERMRGATGTSSKGLLKR